MSAEVNKNYQQNQKNMANNLVMSILFLNTHTHTHTATRVRARKLSKNISHNYIPVFFSSEKDGVFFHKTFKHPNIQTSNIYNS